MTGEDFNLGRFFELATSDKIYVNGLNLHGVESGILLGYTGDFEKIGFMLIGETERETNIRFLNFDDFESTIALDVKYECKDALFTDLLCTLNTLNFDKVNRFQKERLSNKILLNI